MLFYTHYKSENETRMHSEGGFFLQGWQPRIIWIGLGGCVFFTALEEAKKLYLPKEAISNEPSH